jgi:hypothetical protein
MSLIEKTWRVERPCEDGGKVRKRDSVNTRNVDFDTHKMSSLRLLSSAARRATNSFALARRGYAEVSDKLKLTLALPHKVHYRVVFIPMNPLT